MATCPRMVAVQMSHLRVFQEPLEQRGQPHRFGYIGPDHHVMAVEGPY